MNASTCDYYFVWQTAAACPQRTEFGSGCSVVDPVSGYTFDLSPLKDLPDVKLVSIFSKEECVESH